MGINIGFVSTRFAGIDGVTLEASKWAVVFEKNGFNCFWFAGELDRDSDKSFLVPEAHFQHEQNRWINAQVMGSKVRNPSVTQAIHDLRSLLKVHLHEFIDQFDIDLLIAENVLTIPMHIPLGLALTETIAETQIPTIAHNHDFYWEDGNRQLDIEKLNLKSGPRDFFFTNAHVGEFFSTIEVASWVTSNNRD